MSSPLPFPSPLPCSSSSNWRPDYDYYLPTDTPYCVYRPILLLLYILRLILSLGILWSALPTLLRFVQLHREGRRITGSSTNVMRFLLFFLFTVFGVAEPINILIRIIAYSVYSDDPDSLCWGMRCQSWLRFITIVIPLSSSTCGVAAFPFVIFKVFLATKMKLKSNWERKSATFYIIITATLITTITALLISGIYSDPDTDEKLQNAVVCLYGSYMIIMGSIAAYIGTSVAREMSKVKPLNGNNGMGRKMKGEGSLIGSRGSGNGNNGNDNGMQNNKHDSMEGNDRHNDHSHKSKSNQNASPLLLIHDAHKKSHTNAPSSQVTHSGPLIGRHLQRDDHSHQQIIIPHQIIPLSSSDHPTSPSMSSHPLPYEIAIHRSTANGNDSHVTSHPSSVFAAAIENDHQHQHPSIHYRSQSDMGSVSPHRENNNNNNNNIPHSSIHNDNNNDPSTLHLISIPLIPPLDRAVTEKLAAEEGQNRHPNVPLSPFSTKEISPMSSFGDSLGGNNGKGNENGNGNGSEEGKSRMPAVQVIPFFSSSFSSSSSSSTSSPIPSSLPFPRPSLPFSSSTPSLTPLTLPLSSPPSFPSDHLQDTLHPSSSPSLPPHRHSQFPPSINHQHHSSINNNNNTMTTATTTPTTVLSTLPRVAPPSKTDEIIRRIRATAVGIGILRSLIGLTVFTINFTLGTVEYVENVLVLLVATGIVQILIFLKKKTNSQPIETENTENNKDNNGNNQIIVSKHGDSRGETSYNNNNIHTNDKGKIHGSPLLLTESPTLSPPPQSIAVHNKHKDVSPQQKIVRKSSFNGNINGNISGQSNGNANISNFHRLPSLKNERGKVGGRRMSNPENHLRRHNSSSMQIQKDSNANDVATAASTDGNHHTVEDNPPLNVVINVNSPESSHGVSSVPKDDGEGEGDHITSRSDDNGQRNENGNG